MEDGLLVGYDPGGDGTHGIALLSLEGGRATSLSTKTFETTEDVIAHLERLPTIAAIGVDTLTCWSTGGGGWRPADRWLRERYTLVRNSVMTPNGLAGSMGLNGMSVLLTIQRRFPKVIIVETHPKVTCSSDRSSPSWPSNSRQRSIAISSSTSGRMVSSIARPITSVEQRALRRCVWDFAR